MSRDGALTQLPTQPNPLLSHFPCSRHRRAPGESPLGVKMSICCSLVLLSTLHHRRAGGFVWSAGWKLGAESGLMGERQSEVERGLVERESRSVSSSRSLGEKGECDDHLSSRAGESGLVGRRASAPPGAWGSASASSVLWPEVVAMVESRPEHPRPPA